MENNFSEFVGQYEISKTLRFELRPYNNRQIEKNFIENGEFIINNENLVEINILKYKNKSVVFKEINKIFSDFINLSLEETNISDVSFEELYNQFNNYFKDKTPENRKKLNELKKNIAKKFEDKFKNQKIKFDFSDNLYGKEDILGKKLFTKILKEKFKDNQEFLKILEIYKGDTGYFRLNENKKGIFKGDLKKNQIITRIIDNFEKFVVNKLEYEKILNIFEKNNLDFLNNSLKEKFEEYKEIFVIENYNNFLTQEKIDFYNEKIGELNSSELLNHLIQEIKNYNKENSIKIYIPKKLLTLDKQILSGESEENKFEKIENKEEFFEKWNKFFIESDKNILKLKDFFEAFFDELLEGNTFNSKLIFLRDKAIKDFSGIFFNDYNFLTGGLKIKEISEKEFSLDKILKFLDKIKDEAEDIFKKHYLEKISNYKGKSIKEIFIEILKSYFLNFIKDFEEIKNKIDLEKIEKNLFKNGEDKKDKDSVGQIYDFSSITRKIYSFISNFYPLKKEGKYYVEKKLEEKDLFFYGELDNFYHNSNVILYFNQFRNFLTRKSYNTGKIILDFNIEGWPETKGTFPNGGIILKKDGKILLGLLTSSKSRKFFTKENFKKYDGKGEYYEFMEYLVSDWAKVILLQFFKKYGEKYKEKYKIEKGALSELKKLNLTEKQEFEIVQDLISLVEIYVLEKFPKIGEIVGNKQNYKKIDDLERGFKNTLTYNLKFKKINANYVDNLEDLLIFEIYSKDFSGSSNGTMNLNSLYFLGLFNEENLEILSGNKKGSIFKLEGGGQIFFREKSLGKTKEKRTKKDDFHEITSKKRYTENKLIFHFPTKINFTNGYIKYSDFNEKFNKNFIEKNDDIKYLGIDRGEKNLIYISLIDKDGKIIKGKTYSLNGDKTEKYPDGVYKGKLREKQQEMMKSRKTWQEIGTIKELKEGYVSWVVKEIVDLAVKENAVIILEKLFSGFKNSRKKIDRQIYDKFEKALIKKLNYYFKKSDKNGIRNGIQLTPYFYDKKNLKDSDIDKAKQLGILFYVPASYTSQSCPNCGFIKNGFYIKDKKFFEKNIKEIRYNSFKNTFELEYINGENFYTNIERLKKERKNNERIWKTISYDITEELNKFFKENDINEYLKENILNLKKTKFKEFLTIINKIFQLRNSNTENESLETGKDLDFIACPKCLYNSNKKESITFGKNRNIEELKDADANGAYHIARKGKIMIEKIKNKEEKIWPDLEEFKNEIQKI